EPRLGGRASPRRRTAPRGQQARPARRPRPAARGGTPIHECIGRGKRQVALPDFVRQNRSQRKRARTSVRRRSLKECATPDVGRRFVYGKRYGLRRGRYWRRSVVLRPGPTLRLYLRAPLRYILGTLRRQTA